MKRRILTLFLAVLAIGLLGSCSKINNRIDDIDKRVAGINQSIADLGTIRNDILNLQVAVGAKGEDISALQAADVALGKRIDELKTYVGDLSKYAEKDWATATFATLEQLGATNKALSALEELIAELGEAGEASDVRIAELDEKLSKSIKSAVSRVNASISELEARVSDLEEMIQSVIIVPAYSDGSVEVDDKDSLYIDFIVSPASAVANLAADNVAILVNKVKTKAFAGVDSIKIGTGDLFEKDATKGTVSVRVSAADKIPAVADSTITVAVNVKPGISDFTTEFVPVTVAGPDIPAGALPGVFSVSATKQVYFSKGNLYAQKTGDNWTWNFYDEQYKYNSLSTGSSRTATANDTEIDLFTWGYDNTSTKTSYSLNPVNTAGISGHTADGDKQFSASEDWGFVFGGESSVWRTLTTAEWKYLFDTRTVNGGTGEGKSYQRATINSDVTSVYGMILYPDDYTSQTTAASYTSAEWSSMETAGCVFLPAAGNRNGSNVNNVGDNGNYWSSTANDKGRAHEVNFDDSSVYFPSNGACRCYGFSVRLVTEGSAE